jgi:alpha-tubulin suppressor-like RCC1 family protein
MLAAGNEHTCARSLDGSVRCWGANASGQLGIGGTLDRESPAIAMVTNTSAISANGDHTCAILMTGETVCWGANGNGQLAVGTPVPAVAPQPLAISCSL